MCKRREPKPHFLLYKTRNIDRNAYSGACLHISRLSNISLILILLLVLFSCPRGAKLLTLSEAQRMAAFQKIFGIDMSSLLTCGSVEMWEKTTVKMHKGEQMF